MAIPQYVARLREHVGHDLLWLPSVSAVVVDDRGDLLLGKRADDGRWAVISGIVERDEQPAAAIVREVLEETGVRVVPERLAGVRAHTHVYPNGDRCRFLNMAFRCRPVAGTARVNDDESLEVAWFAADQLPELEEHWQLVIKRALSSETMTWFATA